MALAVNCNHQVRTHLRRSNALRIKSNNFELLPVALRESLQAIRRQNDHQEVGEELTLLEQIKRGVKLRPVSELHGSNLKRKQREEPQTDPINQEDESLSTLLMRVLRQRYLAMQQAEGEDDDDDEIDSDDSDDQWDTSSIYSGDLYLMAGYEGGQQGGQLSCVLYGSGGTIDKFNSKRGQTLLERLGEYSTIRMRTRAVDLTNDLVIRL